MVDQHLITPTNSRKSRDLTQFLVGAGLIILFNIGAAFYFFGIDLTEDKRYTMAPTTRQLLQNVAQDVHVEVYLEGDFPAGFKRL